MRTFFLLLLCFLFSSQAQARVLTWPDCVGLVSQNNPELASVRSSLSSSEELKKSAYAGFLPSLNGSVNANYNFPNSSSQSSSFTSLAGNTIGATESNQIAYSSALTLSYNLFSGFKDLANLSRAQANLLIAHANWQITQSKVSDELRRAFVNLDYAKSYVALTDSIIERRSQNERLVRAQYESGRENQGSYLLSQSVLEQSKFDRFQAGNRKLLASQALAHVLGEDGLDFDIVGVIPSQEPEEKLQIERLLPLTPVHLNEEAQIALAKANVKFAESGFYPSLDLSGSVVNRSALLYTDSRQQWSLGLSLSIPLFSGLRTLHDRRSSIDLEKAADFNRVSSDFDTLNQLRQAYFTFEESIQKLNADIFSLNAVTVQEKIARKQYNNGLLNFENWDIIEGNLINFQKTALASKRDRSIAESNWRQIQGQGDLP